MNYTKLNRCFVAKYRFSCWKVLFGCNQISLELQYHKKDDNRVSLCFFKGARAFPPACPYRTCQGKIVYNLEGPAQAQRDCKSLLHIPRGGCKSIPLLWELVFLEGGEFRAAANAASKNRKDTHFLRRQT